MPKKGNNKRRTRTRTPANSLLRGGNGDAPICSADFNKLLMGNPPVSFTSNNNPKPESIKAAAGNLAKMSKSGWGTFPGAPPSPDCTIL